MKQILFFTPYGRRLLQVGIGYDGKPVIVEHDEQTAAVIYGAMNPRYVAQIYKTTSCYKPNELKSLAKKVYEAMQEDSSLSVNDVIHEAMDLLDVEIAEYQAECDEVAVDDCAEQKGELSMS